MTALTLAQSEIFDRLQVNLAELDAIAADRAKRLEAFMEAERQAQAREAALRKQNDDWQGKLRELTITGEIPPITLAFDDAERLIRWAGGEVRLGKKAYLFVKTLYQANGQKLPVSIADAKVWGKSGVSRGAVRTRDWRIRRTLRKAIFPYRIVSVHHKAQTIPACDPPAESCEQTRPPAAPHL